MGWPDSSPNLMIGPADLCLNCLNTYRKKFNFPRQCICNLRSILSMHSSFFIANLMCLYYTGGVLSSVLFTLLCYKYPFFDKVVTTFIILKGFFLNLGFLCDFCCVYVCIFMQARTEIIFDVMP